MAGHKKKAQQLARQLFKASLVNGTVSSERVAGVLDYVEKHQPANPISVLKAYKRYVAVEIAKGQAVIEHAGPVSAATLQAIGASLQKRYARPISVSSQRNDALLAGLRVRIADDVYETSVSGQLATLASAV